MSKPVLLNITLRVGRNFVGARINNDMPQIPGFLAVECPHVPKSTTYINIENIAMFTVLDAEVHNVIHNFPVPKVKTTTNDSV